MESPEKFSNSKEVIAFLAETFPNCFSTEGEAQPLKIGIFQDLAQRLENEERVSKTLLRSTLRHYTNSWRYLHSIKEGAHRVDLDGNQDAQIEKEHADHAKQQLDESKAKAAEKRKAKQKTTGEKRPPQRKPRSENGEKPQQRGKKGTKFNSERPNKTPPAKLTDADCQPGTSVTVKLGKAPMHAVITEVAKDGIHVQLDSGMVVKVNADALRLANSKRS
ncbi:MULTISPECIES: RNA chaperone ProQ [unclassified Alteromonas]|uniref:RNA chaperone ProQ n=1 Tax=unclassified Alteromonas TaxID=2614992 RepID=UPI000E69CA8C|nr:MULTISPECIES: RNA chaperone ProQ [unclassified Alteromonas]AYA64482.1 RNA chaperone ProQ [Alteromonas sp. RKMC-009]MDO6477409.1 RNA chaperone ProQ [Alteromonas sp. 1_MG-2023]MEC7689793.1 RNA chaperone ProQ [Pseudomonadota bacterium]